MSWDKLELDTPCVVIDTETVGRISRNETPRMIQFAWSICTPSKAGICQNDFIIQPDGFDPPPHFISRERAISEGVTIGFVLKSFLKDLTEHRVEVIIAHNLEFEEKVLRNEAQLAQVNLSKFFRLAGICTMRESKSILKIPRFDLDLKIAEYRRNHDMRTRASREGLERYRRALQMNLYKYPTLKELAAHFLGEVNIDWHDANADVMACERCFQLIAPKKIDDFQRQRQEAARHTAWVKDQKEMKRLKLQASLAEFERKKQLDAAHTQRIWFLSIVGTVTGFFVLSFVGAVVGGLLGAIIGANIGSGYSRS